MICSRRVSLAIIACTLTSAGCWRGQRQDAPAGPTPAELRAAELERVRQSVDAAHHSLSQCVRQAAEALCIAPDALAARAARDLGLHSAGEDDSVEILTGGADLDGDGAPDTITQIFLGEDRHVGVYLSNGDCIHFAGKIVAARMRVLDAKGAAPRAIEAWTPAACRDGLGGEVVIWRFERGRYAPAERIECPCGVEGARDPACPQP